VSVIAKQSEQWVFFLFLTQSIVRYISIKTNAFLLWPLVIGMNQREPGRKILFIVE